VAAWLVVALNVVTGNLDREGGMMFTTPRSTWLYLASLIGQTPLRPWKSRVRGLPEFGASSRRSRWAKRSRRPGKGQTRSHHGRGATPALETPTARRLERALGKLECMVSIDLYKNERREARSLFVAGAPSLRARPL